MYSFSNAVAGFGSDIKDCNQEVKLDTAFIKVHVSFVVTKKGKITKVHVLKTECDSCNESTRKKYEIMALKSVKKMPNWEKREKAIRYTIPIKFTLKADELK